MLEDNGNSMVETVPPEIMPTLPQVKMTGLKLKHATLCT
jgi:hypothetical protein